MLNNFIFFLIAILLVIFLNILFNYNIFIDIFLSIELIWLIFFLFVSYLNIFKNDFNITMLIYFIICFASFELIILIMIMQLKKN